MGERFLHFQLRRNMKTDADWVLYLPLFERYVAAKFHELYESGSRPESTGWEAAFLEGVVEPRLGRGEGGRVQVAPFRALWNDLRGSPFTPPVPGPSQKSVASAEL